jgi:hypothetical protein
MGGGGYFRELPTRLCHELFGTILSWNGIGAAMNSKTTVQTLPGRVALELCWCGEVEGLFPAIWSLGLPDKKPLDYSEGGIEIKFCPWCGCNLRERYASGSV